MMSRKSAGSSKKQKSPINRGLTFVLLAVMALSAVFILYTTTSQQDVRGFASEQATAESVTYHCLGNESCLPTATSGSYACPEDMRKCSDGRWVGRSGPKCEFKCGAISVTPLPKTTCTPRPRCLDANPACLPPIPPGGWCGWPIKTTVTPLPKVTCIPRPRCLDGNPSCMIAEPREGWCPRPSVTRYPLPSSMPCPQDIKMCPDGSGVGRIAPKCEFAACPSAKPNPSIIPCPQDIKMCPDGSGVGRVAPKCEFAACPSVKPSPSVIPCPQDIKLCSDGSGVGRVAPRCEFAACPSAKPNPSIIPCPQDIKMCPDGSGVGRVAPKCEFAACPGQKISQKKKSSSGFDIFNAIENLQKLFLK